MKKLRLNLGVILLFACTICFAQTPEEKKQIEKAKRMQDSIMNLPQFKEALKRAKNAESMIPSSIMQMGEEEKKKKKAKKATEEKRRKIESEKAFKSSTSEIKTKENANTYYWLGLIASNTQGKFNNWSFGKADIKLKVYNQESKTRTDLKIGEISDQGQVSISLPQIDFRKWERIPITKGHSEGDDLFADFKKTLEYSNENVTYFATRYGLRVLQGDEYLGSLSIANSVVTHGNLNAPCCMHKGGDGYIAYWVYMSQANTVKEKADNPSEAVDTNLNFNKGWNVVITRVEGKKEGSYTGPYQLGEWKNKYHTATTRLPSDAKFYFSSSLVEDKY